uniref:Tumor necrosis factor receptor superfamily member 5 n=1 Tax=Anoplopoma fimbria TaxID=229290 RepID=C3KJV4_ANOFI|nr:Tumor necrosis factor receptor superfamily member 5 precursor [Anoplopoma fimbria]
MPGTLFSKMHLLVLIITMTMLDLSLMTAAPPACDPITQYVKDDVCCKMCGPGTRMLSQSICAPDPQCIDCEDNEYQDKYTAESTCHRQPYCDPHKNFKAVLDKNKKKLSACMCKDGFHCSSGECITCVPHKTCEPGFGVKSIGNHAHDTVCEKCTGGTFSDVDSSSGVCTKWTECMDGVHVQQGGTDVSDQICVPAIRSHVGLIASLSTVVVFAVVLAAIWFCLCKGKRDTQGNLKACVESCWGDKKEPLREANVLINPPTNPIEEESIMPELQSSQEEAGARTPEENEDEHSQEVLVDLALTENGNYVTQENGKSTVLSRQESQTQTLTESSSCHYDHNM